MVKGDDGYETAYCPRCLLAADEIERLRAALQEVRAGIMDFSGDIIDERILEQIAASIDKALEGKE